MKRKSLTYLLTVLMSMVGANAFAHDIAVKNADGVTIYYNFINGGYTELEVTYYGSATHIYSYYSGTVVIPETVIYNSVARSVTRIGSDAFYHCTGLTSVEIPNSVTSIGSGAFSGCSSLTSVEIPNSVTSIGNGAFSGCSSLTSVEIPNSVTSMGNRVFYGCSGLTSVEIPSSVESIGGGAFDGTAWYNNQPDGMVYAGIWAYNYKGTMPDNTHITLLEGTLRIADSAFEGCTGLISVTIPNSVTSMGNRVFYGCSGLTSVVIPNSVTSIGGGAFYDCSGLTSVEISNSVTSISENEFTGCSSLTSMVIPNSVTRICEAAFYGCTGLTSLTIGNGVTSFGNHIFDGCAGLKHVTINSQGTINYYTSKIGWSLKVLFGNQVEEYIIGNDVTSICNYSFKDCTGITSVTIGNGVTSIGDWAFDGCSGLTSVTIPNSVTSIGKGAFQNCSKLESVTMGTGLLSIDYDVFNNHTPAKVIWLANTPPSGWMRAIGKVNYMANDYANGSIGKTVYPFLSSLFEVDGVKYVPVNPSERTCDAIDCLYCDGAGNINIGETVTNKGVTLTVRQVHPYAFYNNAFINDVDLSFNGNVGDYAFYGCTGLKTATINSKGSLGNEVFRGCTSLETATLGEEIPFIGTYAFSGCSSLKEITIPNAVMKLGQYAFQNCSKMTTAKMGTGINIIQINTFSDCSSLTDMHIGSNVVTIGESAFSGCTSLPVISIPKAVNDIKNNVFYHCTALRTVIMEDREAVLNLGSNGSSPIFSDCPLDSVYFGGNINYSTSSSNGYSPFYRNTSLRAVMITDKETEISENEFYGCTNLKNVYIGDGVESIGNRAFSGCSSLDYFAFGSSVKTIGQEAFSDCTAMTKIISRAATPPVCGTQALDDINKWNCTLEVPAGTLTLYQATDQWKEFFFIQEGEATGISSIDNGELTIDNYYTIDGVRHEGKPTHKGVYIINGKKVVIK